MWLSLPAQVRQQGFPLRPLLYIPTKCGSGAFLQLFVLHTADVHLLYVARVKHKTLLYGQRISGRACFLEGLSA